MALLKDACVYNNFIMEPILGGLISILIFIGAYLVLGDESNSETTTGIPLFIILGFVIIFILAVNENSWRFLLALGVLIVFGRSIMSWYEKNKYQRKKQKKVEQEINKHRERYWDGGWKSRSNKNVLEEDIKK
jgi:hypothetical protein